MKDRIIIFITGLVIPIIAWFLFMYDRPFTEFDKGMLWALLIVVVTIFLIKACNRFMQRIRDLERAKWNTSNRFLRIENKLKMKPYNEEEW